MTSFHLQLTADFTRKVLVGHVDLNVAVLREGTTHLVLDTRNLSISSVSEVDGQTVGENVVR